MIGRLVLCFVILAGSSQLVAQENSVLSVLPGDTTVVLQIPSIAKLSAKFEASPLGKIQSLPEVAPVIDHFKNSLTKMRAEAKEETGFDPWDILTSLQGELVVAYGSLSPLEMALTQQLSGGQPQVNSEDIALLVAFDAGTEKDKFNAVLGRMFELGRQDGAGIEAQAFHGGQLTTITPPEGEIGGPKALYVAEHGSRFLFGLSKAMTEQVMAGLAEGKATGLSQDPVFQTTFSQAGENSDLFFYVDVKNITDSVTKSLSATFFGFFWQQFQSLLLGQSLNNFGLSADLNDDGVRQTVFIHNEGKKEGIWGWFGAPPLDPVPPGYTPEEAVTAYGIALDMGRVIDSLRSLARTAMSMQGGGDPDMLFEQQLGVKLDDVIRAFGGRIDGFSTKAGDPEKPLGDSTFVFTLKDSGPIKQLVSAVGTASGGTMQLGEYQGHQMITFLGMDAGQAAALAITDNRLIFSMEKESVEKVIRRLKTESSSLAGSESFRSAAARTPGKVSLYQYQSREYLQQMEEIYGSVIVEILSALDSPNVSFSATFNGEEVDIPPNLDKALVAALKALSSSFGDVFGWGSWQDAGFYVETVTPFVKE